MSLHSEEKVEQERELGRREHQFQGMHYLSASGSSVIGPASGPPQRQLARRAAAVRPAAAAPAAALLPGPHTCGASGWGRGPQSRQALGGTRREGAAGGPAALHPRLTLCRPSARRRWGGCGCGGCGCSRRPAPGTAPPSPRTACASRSRRGQWRPPAAARPRSPAVAPAQEACVRAGARQKCRLAAQRSNKQRGQRGCSPAASPPCRA